MQYSTKNITIYFGFIFFMGLVIIYKIFTSSIIPNADSPSINTRELSSKFFPEGWGFFTRNPKEPLMDVYAFGTNNVCKKILYPNGDYMFGASRYTRVLSYQLGNLLENTKIDLWKTAKDSLVENANKIVDTGYIEIPASNKYSILKSGRYLLVLTDRLPWLWARNPRNTKPKIKYLIIHIK